MRQDKAKADDRDERREALAMRRIRDAIRSINHGTVTIFVQDGVVIQIDRTEKTRLDYSSEDLHSDGGGI